MRAAERLGHVEHVLEFLIRHGWSQALPGVNRDAGIGVHLAQRSVFVHRDRQPPVLQMIGGPALRGLLVGRLWLTAASSAPALGRRSARKTFRRPIHQLDRADARVDDVLQYGLGALIRHAAVAVRDRADVDAVDHRVRSLRAEQRDDERSFKECGSRHPRQRQLAEVASRVIHTISFGAHLLAKESISVRATDRRGVRRTRAASVRTSVDRVDRRRRRRSLRADIRRGGHRQRAAPRSRVRGRP